MDKELFTALKTADLPATYEDFHRQFPSALSGVTFEGNTALHIAAGEGHQNVIEWILRVEPSMAGAQNNDGNTPLHEAARNGDPDLVGILLQYNRSCASLLNNFGETPLITACKYAHERTVNQLLEAYNDTAEATYEGDRDKSRRCAVHVAAMEGRWDIMEQFMSKRPDCVEILGSDNKSVLQYAVEYNQFEVVKNLLANERAEKKVKLVSRDHDLFQNTALHLAAKRAVDSQLLDLLLSSPGVDVNARNDEDMTALEIASAAAQDNFHCATIIRKLKGARAIHSRLLPNTIPDNIVSAHMVVASLIATVTFAAMFQIPGGIEDDKNNIHYGAAKLALHKLFRLFVFSDSAAFITSLAVVVAWLCKERWQRTCLGSLFPYLLSDISEVNLLLSMLWTAVAFVIATIMVILPHDYDKLNIKDNDAFTKYKSFWQFEIFLVIITPYLSAFIIIAPYMAVAVIRKTFNIAPHMSVAVIRKIFNTAAHMAVAVIQKTLRKPDTRKRALKWFLHDPSTLKILLAQFFMTTAFILAVTFL
ncbi:ankyrin repeat-containing protein ITN1 isoform X2 [Cryptomeria japonica]|uniref:ankyrin repeat-containing protein ITN1 isoform X2 n=1 Tax=Cryptomeria japonica TaxID=3369 RepID=UPI0027DA273C|nr:ankyrin repeat-containing protein ITN1 isoform X2 [Cryptomeria japonica]